MTTVPGAQAPRGQRPRPGAVGVDAAARRPGAGDRDHRDAVPARPPLLRPLAARWWASRSPGRARTTARCGSPATRCSTTACGRPPGRLTVDAALLHLGAVRFPITGPVRYTMTARGRGRALPPAEPARRDPDPLRGLESLSRGPRGDRERSERPRRHPRGRALAADGHPDRARVIGIGEPGRDRASGARPRPPPGGPSRPVFRPPSPSRSARPGLPCSCAPPGS